MRLLTWNTQWCCGLDGVASPERIVGHIRALGDFDVICLQEIADHWPHLPGAPLGDQAARIGQCLPGWQLFFGAATDEFGPAGRQRFGNLVATRLPVARVAHHPLPWLADAGVRSMPRMASTVTLQAQVGGEARWLRVTSTHLEYYSARQRLAQAQALRALHAEACALAAAPPEVCDDGTPFQSKVHTASAILCGDFNAAPQGAEHRLLQAPVDPPASRLVDAWVALHPTQPHPPTFCVHDRRHGDAPVACDFVFVSDHLVPALAAIAVDGDTTLSDHQPVLLDLR